MSGSRPLSDTQALLTQLRATLAENAHSDFRKRRVAYAIVLAERQLSRKRIGKLPVIPSAHKTIISEAVSRGDMPMILAIADARGHKSPDADKIRNIYETFKKENGRIPSIRQLAKAARKGDQHVSRDRLAIMFPERPEPRINPRVLGRRYIDLSIVHFQPGLTVLGYVTNYAPCIEVMSPSEKLMSVMLPTVRSTADRSRVLEFNRIVALISGRHHAPSKPDWEALLELVRQVPAEGLRLFFFIGAARVPGKVKDALSVVSGGERPEIRFVETPNFPLVRMLSPELSILGAGCFPTLGDTVERLEGVRESGFRIISLAQAPVVRNLALKLRLALERKLESIGVHVTVGENKAGRLLGRSALAKDPASSAPALRAPTPIDFSLFQIADAPSEDSPWSEEDSDRIALCFDGVEEVLAGLSPKHLEAETERIIEMEEAFLKTHAGKDMLSCARFFMPRGGNFLGPEFFVALAPKRKLMSNPLKACWAALLLHSFDPDMLTPPAGIEKTAGRSRFALAYAAYLEKATDSIDVSIRKIGSIPILKNYASAFGESAKENLLSAVRVHQIGRLARIWKAGLDEATQRITCATLEMAPLACHMEVERVPDVNKALEDLDRHFRENRIWPTLTVSRRHLEIIVRYWAKRAAQRELSRRGKGKVIPGVNTIAFVYDKETQHEAGGVREETVGGSDPTPPAETLEELLRERMPWRAMAKEDHIVWWRRFLAVLRLAAEQRRPPNLGQLARRIPPKTRKLLTLAGQEILTKAEKGRHGLKLYKEIEAFLAPRTQARSD